MAENLSRPRLLFLLLLLAIAALSERGYADDFSLEDALDDQPTKRPTHKPPKKPSSSGTGDLDLADYFDDPLETTTKPAKVTAGPYPKKPDDSRWNVQYTTTTKQPKTTKAPPKKHPTKDPMDFDLSDALKDQNDGQGGGTPIVNPGGVTPRNMVEWQVGTGEQPEQPGEEVEGHSTEVEQEEDKTPSGWEDEEPSSPVAGPSTQQAVGSGECMSGHVETLAAIASVDVHHHAAFRSILRHLDTMSNRLRTVEEDVKAIKEKLGIE